MRGGAGGDLVEPLAEMRVADAAETAKGGEELVVPTDAGARDEGAHGEAVDEGVIEMLRVRRRGKGVRGADVTFAADGLGRDVAGGADVFDEAEGARVDAEEVGAGIGEKGLGIDGAAEVHVEVRAFGHPDEKGVELERALPGEVEGTDGALLRCRTPAFLGDGGQSAEHKQGEAQEIAQHTDGSVLRFRGWREDSAAGRRLGKKLGLGRGALSQEPGFGYVRRAPMRWSSQTTAKPDSRKAAAINRALRAVRGQPSARTSRNGYAYLPVARPRAIP